MQLIDELNNARILKRP